MGSVVTKLKSAEDHTKTPPLLKSSQISNQETKLIKKYGSKIGFETLPNEIIIYMFRYLPHATLTKTAQVCKQWQQISYDRTLWKEVEFKTKVTLLPGALSYILASGCEGLFITSNCKMLSPFFIDEVPEESYVLKQLTIRQSNINLPTDELLLILNRCTELTHMDIGGSKIDDAVCRAIAKCSKLTELTLMDSFCNNVTYKGLRAIFKGCPRLEYYMESNDHTLTSREALSLLTDPPPMLQMTTLFQYCDTFTDQDVEILVTKAPQLKYVFLIDCLLITEKAIVSLSRLTHLEMLDLTGCKNIPFEALSKLRACQGLTNLVITDIATEEQTEILQQMLPQCRVDCL